ncbi:MAG: zinc-dependent alcohol dehydrogenase, partial [Nocardioides sp.]
MLALEMFRSLPRTVAGKSLGGRLPLVAGMATPIRLVTIDPPRVDRPGWARLRTRLSGICGSDLGAVSGKTSLYFSAVVSFPFVPGHEVVADLMEDCEELPKGTRVVLDPVLTCAARGVEPCADCEVGATNRCSRITVGHLAPGLQTGFCTTTGGGWGQQLSAHRSQLHPVPEGYSDEQAVLVEPIACAVHSALRADVPANARVLVSGAGSVGLLTTLALRELTPAGEIIVVAKHGHQRELALDFGATEVVTPKEVLRRVRRLSGAFQLEPDYSRGYLLGGVDVAFDAVGSKESLETALHATRAGGRVVLSGMPAAADLSAAWFRELEVVGTYASARVST